MASIKAFTASRKPTVATSRRVTVPVVARFSGGREGNVMDRPDMEIKRQGWDSDKDGDMMGGGLATLTDRDNGGTDRARNAPPGGGNYRVLLLNSPSHTEKGVVSAITRVIPGTDEAHAKNCYATSVSLGMAIVVSVLKEHAEFYSEQLYRWGCKTAIEPDTAAA